MLITPRRSPQGEEKIANLKKLCRAQPRCFGFNTHGAWPISILAMLVCLAVFGLLLGCTKGTPGTS